MNHVLRPILAAALSLLAVTSSSQAANDHDRNVAPPDLPLPVCQELEVPAGNRLFARLHALGVQVYQWSGSAWTFVAPEAELFADPCFHARIGLHYAGPTWEAADGSRVIAAREAGCAPYPGAIPWLRLVATETSGRGRFGRVTYIQRLHTIGGTSPTTPGTRIGEEARVPYVAEYLLYRSARD